jgi:ribosome maturation factor RimP
VAIVLQLNPTARKVAETLEPHIERQGYELVGVEFRKGTRSSLLRLLVDRPEGGIALSDIEALSPILSDLLDVYDPVDGRYTLEVSSPGINRPLTKVAHFEAFCGRRVKLKTYQPREGRKVFMGTLAAADESGIALEEENLHTLEKFAFDEIQAANYEHKFD